MKKSAAVLETDFKSVNFSGPHTKIPLRLQRPVQIKPEWGLGEAHSQLKDCRFTILEHCHFS